MKKSLQQQLEDYCRAQLGGRDSYGKLTIETTYRLVKGKLTEIHLKDGQKERTIKEDKDE